MKKEIEDSLSLLLNSLMILAMGITSIVSILMVMKYITEIFALTYISNIDLIKYVIKILGFISLTLITLKSSDIWFKKNPFPVDDKLKFNKYRLFVYIIFGIILFFIGWSLKIFIEIT